MAPKTLLSCPEEILRMILKDLSFADLQRVCAIDRRLHAIAQPLLYSHIQWTYTKSQSPPIAQFLQTLIRRPDLAECIETIHLAGNDRLGKSSNYYSAENKKPQIALSDDVDLGGMVEWITQFGGPYSERWIRELRTGTMDAFVALLLCRAPRLRKLYLGRNYTKYSNLIGAILRSALPNTTKSGNLPSFERLEEVTLLYHPTDYYAHMHTDSRNTDDVLSLFYLPSIRKIEATLENPQSFVWPGGAPPNPSNLTSLKLEDIREEHLGQILSVTRNLQKFSWDWYYRDDLDDEFVTSKIDHGRISKALSHVRETLSDLTISAAADTVNGPEPPTLSPVKPFEAFRHLHRLENIEVPLPILAGFSPSDLAETGLEDALPTNIQWVTITDDLCHHEEWEWYDDDLLECLERWFHERTKSTPLLRGFHLLLRDYSFGTWEPEMTQTFMDLGLKENVDIEITNLQEELY